jgi:hypothetical protein
MSFDKGRLNTSLNFSRIIFSNRTMQDSSLFYENLISGLNCRGTERFTEVSLTNSKNITKTRLGTKLIFLAVNLLFFKESLVIAFEIMVEYVFTRKIKIFVNEFNNFFIFKHFFGTPLIEQWFLFFICKKMVAVVSFVELR